MSTMKIITTPFLPGTRAEWSEQFISQAARIGGEWVEVPTGYTNDGGDIVRMQSGQYTLEWQWKLQDTLSALADAYALIASYT